MSQEAATAFGFGAGFWFFVIFLTILWWVLCIVLFFKVWGMTNNVEEIKNLLKEWLEIEHPIIDDDKNTGLKDKK